MDNDQNSRPQEQTEPMVPKADPGLIYPSVQPSSQNVAEAAAPQPVLVPKRNSNVWSIAILTLLVLTFFTPLGPVLFLPLVIVGIIAAANYVNKNSSSHGHVARTAGEKTVLVFAKTIMIIGIVISVGFLGLIALLFIAIAGGFGEFRMGS